MVDVALTTDSARYDTASPTWLDQVADLRTDLGRAGTGLSVDFAKVPGTKGAVDSIVLTLTSTSTLSATIVCLRAWLARDKTRKVNLSWTEDGRVEHFALSADSMDGEAIHEIVRALGRRIANEKGDE